MRLLFIDRSTNLETVRDLESKARGGMVTSLFKVTDYLAKRHDVTVLSDIQSTGITKAGTKWLHQVWGEFDALICNRGVGDGYGDIQVKNRFLWTHDLPHAGFIPEPRTMRAFTATVFMSGYAERSWRSFYGRIGKSFLIPNGVDKHIFYPRMKDLNYLIYASAPNRGLKRLPFIFDCLHSRVGDHLRMRAYSNLGSLHPGEVRDEEQDGFALIYKDVEDSKVELHKPIPQARLSDELGKAGLMILPTDYPEICSNIILQSLASGTPVITTGRLGSAGEWVKHGINGMLTEWHPVDYMVYQVELIRHAVKVLEDRRFHQKLINRAAGTKLLDWDEVGLRWERMLSRYC